LWAQRRSQWGQRVAVGAAIGVLALALVGGGVLLAQLSAHRPSPTVLASPDASPSAEVSAATTPSPVAVAPPSPSPSPSRPSPQPSPSRVPSPHPTVSHPASPTPAPSPTDCTAGQVTLALATDKASYASGTTITFTVTLKNTGSTTCLYYSNPPQDPLVTVRRNGETFDSWCSKPCGGLPNTGGGGGKTLAPGQSVSQSYTWDQSRNCAGTPSGCTPGPAPKDTYTATATWDNAAPATRSFTIV
jgi:hypothetical protein